MTRHFLTGSELSASELEALLHRATELKAAPRSSRALQDRVIALVFLGAVRYAVHLYYERPVGGFRRGRTQHELAAHEALDVERNGRLGERVVARAEARPRLFPVQGAGELLEAVLAPGDEPVGGGGDLSD